MLEQIIQKTHLKINFSNKINKNCPLILETLSNALSLIICELLRNNEANKNKEPIQNKLSKD